MPAGYNTARQIETNNGLPPQQWLLD